jgi:hypothetical protein
MRGIYEFFLSSQQLKALRNGHKILQNGTLDFQFANFVRTFVLLG